MHADWQLTAASVWLFKITAANKQLPVCCFQYSFFIFYNSLACPVALGVCIIIMQAQTEKQFSDLANVIKHFTVRHLQLFEQIERLSYKA
jgi:hypothetical protein